MMSGWTLVPHRDTQTHVTWSELTLEQRNALVHTTMRVHGYDEDRARKHFTGSADDEEAMVLLITHDMTLPPTPPPHTPTPPHGRLARRAQVGLRRNPSGVVRPRRQRAVTSRHTAATLNTVERALRGTTSADTGVT